MRSFVLSSGSSANCFYVETENNKFLIDCGLSFAKTKQFLNEKNIDIKDIDGIFVTHEHSDHIAGFFQIFKQLNCNFYMTIGTFEGIKNWEKKQRINKNDEKIKIIKHYDLLKFGDLKVLVVNKPHDAKEAVSFVFENSGSNIGIFTDLGHVTNEILLLMKKVDILYLETNYSSKIINERKKDYNINYLNRLVSDLGHLGLEQVLDFLDDVLVDGNKLILSHISENTNSYEYSYQKVREFLKKQQKNVEIIVSFQQEPSDWI